ncbi:MAG: CBS domain-containing protein [Hyphomonadaceae bacterium]|nr:CBS domain-containing protein [Hyphomonadaceae bacterium]
MIVKKQFCHARAEAIGHYRSGGVGEKKAVAQMAKNRTDLVVVSSKARWPGVRQRPTSSSKSSRCVGAGCVAQVDSVMTRDVTYCQAHEILLDIWSVMKARGYSGFRPSTQRRPIGIVYARELLRALLSEAENEDELLRGYISGVGYR